VLTELRDRLRAGDVWVTGSRQHKAFEDRIISMETLQQMQVDGGIPVAVETDFEKFIAQRRTQLDERMATIDASAKRGLLPDFTLEKGILKISPLEKSTPPEAEALAGRLYAMLPRIRVTDLMPEVARWTLITDCFTHLRTGETIDDPRILMTGLLADGLNLGLTRMAEACSIASLGQLAWAADWHIRDESYGLALVLDGLLNCQAEAGPGPHRHHTDGGGVSDHVFALCTLLGFQFAPRIPDLKDRRLYSFAKAFTYPTLEQLIAGRIDVGLIRAHWTDILRIAASIRTGTVTASLILRQLASYPHQNGVAAALRELGRLERTLFTLDWLEDLELRRQTSQELNKGESRNSLARAVFIHRLGEIRDRTFENQKHRASGFNLIVTAIILWNTRYRARAIETMRKTERVPDDLLAHLSPLGWEHVNLTGDYIWGAETSITENTDGLRPLRAAPAEFYQAA
jgi:hypothetical protein